MDSRMREDDGVEVSENIVVDPRSACAAIAEQVG